MESFKAMNSQPDKSDCQHVKRNIVASVHFSQVSPPKLLERLRWDSVLAIHTKSCRATLILVDSPCQLAEAYLFYMKQLTVQKISVDDINIATFIWNTFRSVYSAKCTIIFERPRYWLNRKSRTFLPSRGPEIRRTDTSRMKITAITADAWNGLRCSTRIPGTFIKNLHSRVEIHGKCFAICWGARKRNSL
jgi:hypothetical protein